MNEKNPVLRTPWPQQHRIAAACLVAISTLAASGLALADPPTSVVRLAYADGPLSFAPAGENDWVSATVNRPLVTGDHLWADAGARADLRLSRSMLHIGANTSLTLLNADDRSTQLRLDEGTLDLNVKQVDATHALEVDTPNLAYSISQPGVYRIDVDPQGTRTSISVHSGSGQVYAGNQAFVIKAGQVYDFRGNTLADYDTHALAPPDDFDRWAISRDQRWEHAASARYVPPEMIGSEDLDDYGQWHNEPQYGAVWMPQHVAADWAPYRDGHWAWIDPWGWTWIDDAPWGFAPSHYGRWSRFDAGWGWVPGPARVQPVYAPAVVQFVGGVDSRSALTIAGVAAVAWFALAPHEVYRPSYTVSRDYMNRINTSNTIVNTTVINNFYRGDDDRGRKPGQARQPEPRQHFANQQVRGGVVAVPSANFAQAQPVGRRVLAVTAQAVAAAPVFATAHVAPVRESVLGNAAPAHGRPPEAASNRAVIARTAPPPAARPFAERQAELAQHPGRPVDVAAGRPQAAAAPGTTPAVRQQAAPGAPVAPVIAAAAPAKLRPTPLPNRPLAQAHAAPPAPMAPQAPVPPQAQAALAQHPAVQAPAAQTAPVAAQHPPVQAQAGDPRGREARPGPAVHPQPVPPAATPAPAAVAAAQAQREAAQARAVERPAASPPIQQARPAVEAPQAQQARAQQAQQAHEEQQQRQARREPQLRPERPAPTTEARREAPVVAARPAPAAPRPAERAPVAAAPRPAAPPPERHAEQPRPEVHARPAEQPQERSQERPQPQSRGQGRDDHGKG